MGKWLTLKEVIDRANKIHNFKFDYSKAIYFGGKEKFEIICSLHGSFWQSPEAHFHQKQGCNLCATSHHFKYNNASMDLFLAENNIPVERLDDCVNSSNKIRWKCKICKYEWPTKSHKIVLRRHDCPNCAGNAPLTDAIIDERLLLQGRPIIRASSCQEGAMKNMDWKCIDCNHLWPATPNNILNHNRGCPNCNGTIKLTNEIVDQRLLDDERPIKRIGDYVDAKAPIDFKCLNENCNNIWKAVPDQILNGGSGCRECSSGKNEKIVGKLLQKYQIKFEKQKSIPKISSPRKRILVDYFIPEVNTIIEYNGAQHYQPVCFGGMAIECAETAFVKQQARDQYLQQFCDDNSINLIWIDGRKYFNKKLKRYLTNEIIPSLKEMIIKNE